MSSVSAADTKTIDVRDQPSALRVRRARSIDLTEVAALWADCGLVPPPAGFRNEMQRKLLSDPDLFLLAADPAQGGRIVGALLGGYDGRTATVSRLVTHPDRRRQGVAAQLVAAFTERVGDLAPPGGRVVLLDGLDDTRALFSRLGHPAEPDLPAFRLAAPPSATHPPALRSSSGRPARKREMMARLGAPSTGDKRALRP